MPTRAKVRRTETLNHDLTGKGIKKVSLNFWEALNDALFNKLLNNQAEIRSMIRNGGRDFMRAIGLPEYNKMKFTDVQKTLFDEYKKVYNKSGSFALKKLNVEINFKLTNPNLMTTLERRLETFPESSKVHFEDTMQIIERQFIRQGEAPYSKKFISSIQNVVGDYTEDEAVRFARTETGVIMCDAEYRTYKENGVTGKQWLTALLNVRPTHAALKNKIKPIDEPFDVGGYSAMHPMDSSLPAGEVINCRCDIAPVYMDGKKQPKKIWSGQ